MTDQSIAVLNEDRVMTRIWELDLSTAGKVYSPKKRPTRRRRQQIAQFLGCEGSIERFAIRQTLPQPGHMEDDPPSQAQYGAVTDFFAECCETRHQAKTLLSARDYAEAVVRDMPFTVPRRQFIWFCATAFILADKELRSRARSWSGARHREGSHISAGIANENTYKAVRRFTARLIDDMRAQGSHIFG